MMQHSYYNVNLELEADKFDHRLNDLTILVIGDLLVKDSFGATAVDYVRNKHLNYCGMVIRAHSQCSEHQTLKNAFVSTPSSIER